jgi:hypothetical protein
MLRPKTPLSSMPRCPAGVLVLLALVAAVGCAPALDNPNQNKKDDVVDAGGEVAQECTGQAPLCGEEALGICAGQSVEPVCLGGEWVCEYEGQVEEDTLCDGLDSDCDGVADEAEVVLADIESCSAMFQGGELKGACAAVAVTCLDGAHVCDFSKLANYTAVEGFDQEDLGRWCDGIDNDCDGDVDENMLSNKGFSKDQVADDDLFDFGDCPFVGDDTALSGVCGGDVSGPENNEFDGALMIRCDGGKLECGFACTDSEKWDGNICDLGEQLDEAGYQQEETLCDGLDNDCDGEVDDVFDVAASGCPYQGVCKGRVEAICKDLDETTEEVEPGWVCIFDNGLLLDPDFVYQDLASCAGEPGCGAETTCDGLDNDCDGLVDEGLEYPQECFSQALDGSVDYRCDDEEFPQCAAYHPQCEGSSPPAFQDCPVWASQKVDVDGVSVQVPAVTSDGLPLLPGVCAFNQAGTTPVRYSCQGKNVDSDEEDDINMWMCDYSQVPFYNASETLNDAQFCDGRDNDCDGVVDGELKGNGKVIYITANKASPHVPCRSLGACAGHWEATCNLDGNAPGKWFCEFTSDDIEMVDPNNPDCEPGYANCLWVESRCDGLDNDCDGLVDELLDGYKVDLETACAAVKDVGVCSLESLNTVCADIPGGGKGFACDFSAVDHYSPVEESAPPLVNAENCDGRDNDCDGEIDEGIHFFSPSLHEQFATGCLFKGVCAAGTKATCTPAQPVVEGKASWKCDYSALGADFSAGSVEIGAVLTEVKCDGKDNDCDGLTDEGLSQDLPQAGNLNPKTLSGCPQKGICAGVMKWNCDLENGIPTWNCDPTDVGLSYETVETRCDGIDNDCDGQADKGLSNVGPNGANCKTAGVCAEGGVTAACIDQGGQAAWVCYYDEVVEYDGVVETSCDGKDNDCDGFVDEDLDWEAVNACSKQGVCNSPLLDAECQGQEGWYCKYGLIGEWEEQEVSCDQQDNDCDGLIDELSCDICEPCQSASYCTSGVCAAVPTQQGEGIHYCSYSNTYCVYTNPYSKECDFVTNNESACANETTSVLCGNGVWFAKSTCTGANPVCWEGECKVCVPGKKSCDGNTVKACNAQGTGWQTEKICAGDTICIGEGACVFNTEFKVNSQSLSGIQSIDSEPKIVPRVGGGFAVVYTARDFVGGDQTDVLLRLFTSGIQPVGVQETLVNSVVSGVQQNAEIDNIPTEQGGMVVVWEDSNGPTAAPIGTDIVAQMLSDAGQPLGDRFMVNTTITGNQTGPTVAAFSNGTFLIAWEHDANGVEEPEVMAQAFKADGTKFGGEFQVNTYVPSEQRYPALTRLAGEGYVTAWSSLGQVDNLDVFYQRFDKNFSKKGSEMQANIKTASLQNKPVVSGFAGLKAGAFVMAWESFGQDASSMGVVMNLFDKNGNAVFQQDALVNKLVQSGSQRDPAICVLDDNHFVIAWESQGLPGDNDLEGVAAKVFDANGTEADSDEHLVNEVIVGRQTNPDITQIPGAGYVVVWFSQPGASQYNIKGRVFKVQ